MASQILRRFYAPEFMVKKHLKKGDIPGTREAYSIAMSTAWAAIVETFLIALISMADTVMVSTVGETAIAAVGLCSQPRFIVQALVLSMNVAVTSICARRRGQEDPEGALSCLKQGLVLSAILSVVITGIAFMYADQMIWLVGAKDDSFEMARAYYGIILLGIPLNNLSLTISSAQRGIGYTKVSMNINMTSNAINLFFNYLLINGVWFFPRLEVRGAAIATVIGWGAGLIIAFASVCRRGNYFNILTRGGWKFDREVIKPIIKVTSGSFVEQLCMRIGFLLYTRIVAGLGTAMMATHVIVQNIMSLSFSFGEGFGISASALVGRNLGAKRSDLSIIYGKICQRMSLLSSCALFIVFACAGRYLLMMFTRTDEILIVGQQLLVLVGIIIFGQSSQMVFMGSLRGAGDTRHTAIISLICIVLLRPIMSYTLAYEMGWGLFGAWCGFLLDQYLRLVLTYQRFSSGKWSNIEL